MNEEKKTTLPEEWFDDPAPTGNVYSEDFDKRIDELVKKNAAEAARLQPPPEKD